MCSFICVCMCVCEIGSYQIQFAFTVIKLVFVLMLSGIPIFSGTSHNVQNYTRTTPQTNDQNGISNVYSPHPTVDISKYCNNSIAFYLPHLAGIFCGQFFSDYFFDFQSMLDQLLDQISSGKTEGDKHDSDERERKVINACSNRRLATVVRFIDTIIIIIIIIFA